MREFEHLIIPEFKIANKYQRDRSRGGGVMIFIKESIKFTELESPVVIGNIETTAIKVHDTAILALYRPPSGNKDEFVQNLTEWVSSLNVKNVFIAGDFNLNVFNQDRTYFESLEANTGFKPRITSITRVESNSCIDNILTNVQGTHKVSNTCIADHQALISNIKTRIEKIKDIKYRYREMKEPNWRTFSEEIDKIVIRGPNTDDKWTNVTSDIKAAVIKAFPEKESKIKYKFSMSQGMLKSKNKKNKLLSQYKRGIIEKEVYIRYNKIYRKLISKEQEKSFHDKIVESGTDSKKKWSVFKSELKLKENKSEIEVISNNGKKFETKKDIAKEFKSHFETCANNLARGLPNSGECNILIDQKDEWQFQEITETELRKIIDSILPKSSCGFDLLTNRMLKKEKNRFSRLLINLINETLRGGTFPKALKIAKVIPIFKKGDKTNMNNYRPISLLPVLSKVLEKVLNKQITKKLDDMHIIDDNQYGFRAQHSTADAVTKFIDYIERAKTRHKHVVSIHIDVSKAFDSCNHDILVAKLKRIGISGNSIELMKSYLKDRIQELWLDNECGGRFVINIGVGQGTVLGPTLFKIFIMDMYLSTGLFSLRFADDSNLVGHGSTREIVQQEINEELSKLHDWFCRNKLTLHPDKSRVIIHTKDKLMTFKLGGKNLMRCGYGMQEEGVKFLGIIIDENLDWKLQVSQVKKKIGKGNYLLWRYRNRLTTNMKKTIYECFIRTHLTYCISTWGAKKSNSLTELKKLVKKSWTKIGIRKQHTNERLIEHRILKFEDELRLAESKLIWSWKKNKIPIGLQNIIETRGNNNLRNQQFVRDINWKQDSIAYRLATRATKEISDIEIARSKKGLVKKISNTTFLTEYNTRCRIRNCFICSNQTGNTT